LSSGSRHRISHAADAGVGDFPAIESAGRCPASDRPPLALRHAPTWPIQSPAES
jgi:hypothetical protein